MTLANLTHEKMIRASKTWLSPSGSLRILEAHDLLNALIPKLKLVHRELLNHRNTNPESLKDLARQAYLADRFHDSKVKGIYNLLTALAELTPETHDIDYKSLRDSLFPDGLATAELSYRDEARSASSVLDRLSREHKDILNAIQLPWGCTLEDEVRSWINSGKDLGAIEDKWANLKQRERQTPTSHDAHVRKEWLKVVSTLMKVIELEALSQEERQQLLRHLS